ncbi:MAG TPA: NfeD family protein [Thermoleophilaceae bacterium]|jgi:membrane protein implicated in regulation of membrane protease activity|nr:NfeD family protein [Thermoleophilaceae bacterium]
MAGWVVWLLVAVALAVGEIFTLGFFLGPVALAAALAAVAAGLGLGFEAQLAVFVVASLASLLLVRPVARRHLRTPARLRTGAAALVGEAAVVLERIDRGGGSVRLRGEVWSARALDAERVLEPGTEVQVVEIDGATAVVAD